MSLYFLWNLKNCGCWEIDQIYILEYFWQDLDELVWCLAFSICIWLMLHSPLNSLLSATEMNEIESINTSRCNTDNLGCAVSNLKSSVSLGLSGLWQRSGHSQWKKMPNPLAAQTPWSKESGVSSPPDLSLLWSYLWRSGAPKSFPLSVFGRSAYTCFLLR